MRITLFLLAFFLSTLTSAHIAHATQSEQQAGRFVDNLFFEFQEIYKEENTQQTEDLFNYYQQNFDNKRIARFVLGKSIRKINMNQLKRFKELFPRFMLAQISPQIAEYFSKESTQFKVSSIEPLRKKDLLVKTFFEGKQKVAINIRIRPENDHLKILDVQIAGISMILTQRDLISSMIKQANHDIDQFLDQLEEKIEQLNTAA